MTTHGGRAAFGPLARFIGGDRRPATAPAPIEGFNWLGAALHRNEDERLVRGEGRFVGDARAGGMLHAVVLRSQHARARLTGIDVSAALEMPGVRACLTARDVADDGLGGIPWEVCPPGFEQRARFRGDPGISVPQPLLAHGELRYVGEPLAFVIAESRAAALEGAEAIVLDVEELESVTDTAQAISPGAPALHDAAPGNTLFEHSTGDAAATESAFARAAHVVELFTHVPRLAAAPIETRGYMGTFNPRSGRYTLVAAAGKPHPVRNTIAEHILKVPPKSVRVIARDIGGGFGGKNVVHAEAALVLWAARRLGAPVRWISDRSEAFLSDMQGRDQRITAALALDSRGRFLAARYDSLVNLGAYLAPRAVIPCMSGHKIITGPYRMASAHARVRAVHTNTVPTCPYRGAGVPEIAFALERLVDMAARRLKLDPAELRRRNLVRPRDLPFATPSGTRIHSVDYPAMLSAACEGSEWRARRGGRRRSGTLRHGVGMSFSIEAYGTGFDEAAEIVATPDERVEVRIGTMSSGQSHETAYAQIAADVLGIPPDRIRVVQGDTDRIRRGNGTGASRSLTIGGSAVHRAAQALIEAARPHAARLMQRSEVEILFTRGRFVSGSGALAAGVTLGEAAGAAPRRSLHISRLHRPELFNFPAGCHVAEVEVDVETGTVHLVRYDVFHDTGVAVNPMVVAGQLHGGLTQGIGAALMEAVRYEPDSGQALTASFLDYAMPRAGDIPSFEVSLMGVRCSSNPLGVKAVGEAGPVAAPPAVVNAIVDALRAYGVEHLDMPVTGETVWRAIAAAGGPAQSTTKSNVSSRGA